MEIRFGRRDTHSEQQTKKKAGGKSEEKIFFLYEKQWSCSIGQGETKHFKKKKNFLGNITNYISRGVHWSTKKITPYYVIYKLTE